MAKKCCSYCGEWYPEASFGVALTTKTKVYRRRKCPDCYRKTKQILIQRYHQWITDYKRQRGCKRCGTVDPRILDFHHRTGTDKEFTLGYFRRAGGFDRIQKEVAKCEVLCANCHRILHCEEREELL